MSDESHKAVLDREFAIEGANPFKDALELLNELIDYGTNLVPRAFLSSPRDVKAICVIFVQLRQFIVHLDGVAILGVPAIAPRQIFNFAHYWKPLTPWSGC